jgi:hypothetical protein
MSKIKLSGTSLNELSIGNSSTADVKLVNTSGVLEVKDTSNALQIARVKKLNDTASPNINDVATYYDVAGKIVNITFDFDGGSAPSAGTNTNEYGFCHTSGGGFTAGYVYFDNGSALVRIFHVTHITSTTAVTGTISLNANGIYASEGGSWVLKGDGAGGGEPTGMIKTIKVPFAYTNSTVSSTTSIVDGAIITRVDVVKTQAFNGTTPTLKVELDGTSDLELMATTDIDLTSTVQDTTFELFGVTSSNEGVIKLTVTTSGASAGAGYCLVSYCLTQNA